MSRLQITVAHSDDGETWHHIHPWNAPEPLRGWRYRVFWTDERGSGSIELPAGFAVVSNYEEQP